MEASDLSVEAMLEAGVPAAIQGCARAVEDLAVAFKNGGVPESQAGIELPLAPIFQKADGEGFVDTERAGAMAETVLAGLASDEQNPNWMTKSEKLERQISPAFSETYWQFVDSNMFNWYVTEVRDKDPVYTGLSTRAFVTLYPPERYTEMLKEAAKQQEQVQENRTRKAAEQAVEPTEAAKRQVRVGRAVAKWWHDQKTKPHPRNRV